MKQSQQLRQDKKRKPQLQLEFRNRYYAAPGDIVRCYRIPGMSAGLEVNPLPFINPLLLKATFQNSSQNKLTGC